MNAAREKRTSRKCFAQSVETTFEKSWDLKVKHLEQQEQACKVALKKPRNMQREWRNLFGKLNHRKCLIHTMEGESERIQEEVRVTKEKWDKDTCQQKCEKKSCKKRRDKLRERKKSSKKSTCKYTVTQ